MLKAVAASSADALGITSLTGDITATGPGAAAATIANNGVTYAKFQQVAASSLVGNATGSTANATGITIGAALAFSGAALQTGAGTGDVTWAANSFSTTLATTQSALHTWTLTQSFTAGFTAYQTTAIPAGGTDGVGMKVSSVANFGVFFGSGAPSLSAAKGSLYLRSDGSGATDRMYVATDAVGTWTAVATVG